MAISGINWLGSKLGVDITGASSERDNSTSAGGGFFDRMGAALFHTEKEKEEIPEDAWGYVYNESSKVWEPDQNAPEWAHREHRERLENPVDVHGKPLKKAEVAPPPPPPAPTTFLSSPQATGKYVDCFSGGNAQSQAAVPPPRVGAPSLNPHAGSNGFSESTPQDLVMLKASAPVNGMQHQQPPQQHQQPQHQQMGMPTQFHSSTPTVSAPAPAPTSAPVPTSAPAPTPVPSSMPQFGAPRPVATQPVSMGAPLPARAPAMQQPPMGSIGGYSAAPAPAPVSAPAPVAPVAHPPVPSPVPPVAAAPRHAATEYKPVPAPVPGPAPAAPTMPTPSYNPTYAPSSSLTQTTPSYYHPPPTYGA
eukprot:TRINITY_DN3022_c5_g1_i1.p1 TRINITY_DN3022_c5_g1~~TRINITY_DN3022_c5_g1_i1.p1  ORF type:complete len:376 (+),score=78.37 TRINITY_DN3022_c5_g1_i1:45-1130(+)